MNLLLKPIAQVPFKGFRAERYAWPGGYSLTYLSDAYDVICARCASLERFSVRLSPYVHWEGPAEYCAACNAELPSEYGDPDASEECES